MCLFIFLVHGCAHGIVVIRARSEIRMTSSNYGLGHIMHITLQFIAVICCHGIGILTSLLHKYLKTDIRDKKHENTHDLLHNSIPNFFHNNNTQRETDNVILQIKLLPKYSIH